MRRSSLSHLLAVLTLVASACQCGPGPTTEDDAGVDDAGMPRRDGGVIIIPPQQRDAGWPSTYASEPCPDELMDGGELPDGSVRFGICIVLHTLSAPVTLDDQPETNPIEVHFLSGTSEQEITRTPDSSGLLQVRAMRGRYDILKHQPGGVWPYFEGFLDHGFLDLTSDQTSEFTAKSHRLRGAVRFGTLPFTPSGFPPDVYIQASGTPDYQLSGVTSSGGSYELKLLEGTFGLYLSSPAVSLFGTELTQFPLTRFSNITFDRDQEFDIDIASSVLEGRVTIDGQPLPDARPGPDFSITYTRPGDTTSAIRSRHEGGTASFTALVPKGLYGTRLDFEGAPNRSLPSRIFGLALKTGLDLNADNTLAVNFDTVSLEGSIVIDGVPARPNPFYNFQLYFFGAANMVQGSDFFLYEVPLESASFNLRIPTGRYFAALSLDDGLADDLAAGFWVVDRFFVVDGNRSMPITLETRAFQGKITIDGQPPIQGKPVGTFTFRNRALSGQYSFFQKSVLTAEDGSFRVKLPRGEYEVFFTINAEAYPTYAQGRQSMFARVDLDQDYVNVMDYRTIALRGPLRVDRQVVGNTLGGAEVGLRMERQQDFQDFEWKFYGGTSEYEVRVPPGTYAMDFIINENAFPGVAFGNAPMGMELNIATPAPSFMSFLQ